MLEHDNVALGVRAVTLEDATRSKILEMEMSYSSHLPSRLRPLLCSCGSPDLLHLSDSVSREDLAVTGQKSPPLQTRLELLA